MADPILHIKDSYYFEVPRFLARSDRGAKFFPEFWVRLDDQFQDWEAGRLYHELEKLESLPVAQRAASRLPEYSLIPYHEWKHDHAHHGKPFDVYLEHHYDLLKQDFKAWKQSDPDHKSETFDTFLAQGNPKHSEFSWFAERRDNPQWAQRWEKAKAEAGGDAAVEAFQKDDSIKWSPTKIEGYNNALHGKILIPQLFGTQKNLYEMESGLGISKFMILELLVAITIGAVFIWLAGKVKSSDRPKGKIWNMLEAVLLFIRNEIARPSIDAHHDEGKGEGHEHAAHGHDAHAHAGHAHAGHAHAEHAQAVHKSAHEHEGDKYVPYLWTIFLFILGCNLIGMFPWAGAPAASFSVTLALAAVTFLVGFFSGVRKFGFVGYWKNLVPSMDLPIYMAIPLLPAIFVVEVMGLFIKHGVLGIRLLANIAAGHLVLVSLLGLTFSLAAAESMGIVWPFASIIVVLGSAALSCLELFVAFLQAYVFTLLSALFIGAAVHRH